MARTRLARLAIAVLLATPLSAQLLTLQQALDTAGKANPELQRARLRVLESEAQAEVQRSVMGPQLSLGVSQSYQTSNLAGIGVGGAGFPSRVGPYRVFDTRPRLTQTVLDLSLPAAWRAARERAGQAREEAAVTGEQTLAAVIDVYLRALAADSRARAGAARVETARALLGQVSDAERAGTSSQLDVSRARQQLESEQAALLLARRDRDALVTVLKRTVGLEQAVPVELEDVAAAAPESAPLIRPEIRALEANRRALQQDKVRAQRERWPTVTAFGDFGVLGQDPTQALSTFTVGASLNIPLWTSGRIANQISTARLRIEQADRERRALDLEVSQEEAQARLQREAAREALVHCARATAAARQTLQLARLRFGAGLTTNLDVIAAQGNLAQAEDEEIRTRYDGLLAAARLALARGDVMSFVRR
jgi:outer membrane protein TolC